MIPGSPGRPAHASAHGLLPLPAVFPAPAALPAAGAGPAVGDCGDGGPGRRTEAVGRTGATRVPLPTAATTSPRPSSSANAVLTVTRLTPRSAASARLDGNRLPGGSAPP